jgi:signal transduction histidine kinase
VATLRGYLESTLEHWDGAPPRDQRQDLRRDLQVMAGETERLQGLIEDLFALSRAEVGRLPLDIGPTDVGALLRRSAAAAARLAWERGRVEVLAEVPPALPAARADAGRLEQAVRNLVANAVRHTPPGGLVLLLTAEAVAGGVAVQVKDTGEGIAPKDLPHIWERFYRSSTARERDPGDGGGVGTETGGSGAGGNANRRNGTAHGAPGGAGLGLALVKEVIEAMGGSVGVDSTVGQGSTFTLRLPAA